MGQESRHQKCWCGRCRQVVDGVADSFGSKNGKLARAINFDDMSWLALFAPYWVFELIGDWDSCLLDRRSKVEAYRRVEKREERNRVNEEG